MILIKSGAPFLTAKRSCCLSKAFYLLLQISVMKTKNDSNLLEFSGPIDIGMKYTHRLSISIFLITIVSICIAVSGVHRCVLVFNAILLVRTLQTINWIQSTTAESGSLLVFELFKICGACGKSFSCYKIMKILLPLPLPKVSSLS